MFAIIDTRAPEGAKNNLRKYADIIEFKSENLTFEQLSGHPDIFIHKFEDKIILAPNCPDYIVKELDKRKVKYIFGNTLVKETNENSISYNCVETKNYFIHKISNTDSVIFESVKPKNKINIPQGFTRCSLTALSNTHYISSDKSITKILSENNLNCLYVEPDEIVLPGYKYGLFGGTNGVINNKIFFIGNLEYHPKGKEITDYITSQNIEIINLYDGKLFDGGGLFFFEE